MVMQRPVIETGGPATAALSRPPNNPTQMASPAPRPPHSDRLLDGEKTGATLLFSGLFLTIVGVIFTAMGWEHYLANPTFEWSQVLGPVMISVGGTFMMTSVCKFQTISCSPCGQWDEEVIVAPVAEQTSMGHPFTLSGVNQPVVLRDGTTMLCVPPYFINQDVPRPGWAVNVVRAAVRPPDYFVNGAFTAEEGDGSTHSTDADGRRRRAEKPEGERGRDDSASSCSRPPAYEDIYPSYSKDNQT